MSYDFNADDVFEMAEQIERNGAVFYRKAAADIKDPDAKNFLSDLAAMEDSHEKTFSTMRKKLTEAEQKSTVFEMPKMVEMRPVTNPTNCRSSSRDRGVSFYRFFDARKSERSAKAKQCLRRSIKLMLDS